MTKEERRHQHEAFLKELQARSACADCGVSGSETLLVWHHRPGVEFGFHVAGVGSRSRELLLAELEKCDPLCRSCHKQRHARETPAQWTRPEHGTVVHDSATQRRLPGPRSKFRGKIRTAPVVVTFTAEGHAALAEGVRQTGLSKADYVEMLLRRAVRCRPPEVVR